MAQQQEIQKAIGAHEMCRASLKGAIDSGKTDAPVGTIRADNQCEFGKWLYGDTLSAQDKAAPQYSKVKGLHSQFHKTAATVATLALSGKKAEAGKMLDAGGDFAEASAKLTGAMMEWHKVLK